MADKTKIQWADASFSPWIGCTKVSAGCANCYAENTTRARVLRSKGHETWGKGAKRSRTSAAYWKDPIKWNREAIEAIEDAVHDFGEEKYIAPNRMKVFPSLCDWLDDEVPIEWLADFLKLIYDTPHLTWLLLTKRPENFFPRLNKVWSSFERPFKSQKERQFWRWINDWIFPQIPRQNVWILASVENQKTADERIPELLKIPAKIRGLSAEPMLGPIEFSDVTNRSDWGSLLGKKSLHGIDWVIFGGESGPGARGCNVDWIREGLRQCKVNGVKAFVKQLGANVMADANEPWANHIDFREGDYAALNYRLTDKKGGDMNEWPVDLRVREFPVTA